MGSLIALTLRMQIVLTVLLAYRMDVVFETPSSSYAEC